jgi:DNA-binding LacI/PurR family transcriptional regulator
VHSSTPLPLQLPRRISLVAQTIQTLQQGIESKHWHDRLPSERELCESLQVSRRTLRAALNELQRLGHLQVSGKTTRQIISPHGPKDLPDPVKIIGVLTPTSFLSLPAPISYVMDTLRSRLTTAGYEVQFHINPACYGSNPARALTKFFADHPATAWLILSAQETMQRWLKLSGQPCLILGSTVHGITLPSIDTDFHAACHHAGALLWRKGHRNIALVLPEGQYGGDIASEEGFREALESMPGIKLRVLRHAPSAASLCALLDDTLSAPEAPTAYIVARAAHVMTVMMHLMRRGKRIPDNVAVVSRDNDPVLDATSPPVARYGIQPKQLANRIAAALSQLADTGILGSLHARLMPEYLPGESL